jgi:hypothetical protein
VEQVLHHRDPALDDLSGGASVQARHERDAARVMLERGVV